VLSVAIALGALLSGGLVALDPFDAIPTLALPILVALGLGIVNLIAILALMDEHRHARGVAAVAASIRAVPHVIGDGLGLLRTSRVLLALVGVELFWGFAMVTFENLFPIRLSETLGSTHQAAAVMGPVSSAAWFVAAAGAAGSSFSATGSASRARPRCSGSARARRSWRWAWWPGRSGRSSPISPAT